MVSGVKYSCKRGVTINDDNIKKNGVGRMVVIIDYLLMPKKIKSEACSTGWCKHHLF